MLCHFIFNYWYTYQVCNLQHKAFQDLHLLMRSTSEGFWSCRVRNPLILPLMKTEHDSSFLDTRQVFAKQRLKQNTRQLPTIYKYKHRSKHVATDTSILRIQIRNMKMVFDNYGTWRQVTTVGHFQRFEFPAGMRENFRISSWKMRENAEIFKIRI